MKRKSKSKSPEKHAKISSDAPSPTGSWSQHRGMLHCNFGGTPSSKVIGFDMDSTLITTKSGKTFAVNADDWKLLYSQIPSVLQKYEAQGYRFAIFTNQKGVSVGKTDPNTIKTKIANVIQACGVPMYAMAATGDDEFRKPCRGMWDYLIDTCNGGSVDLPSCIYVGDAAGRPARAGRKKDFNDTDLKYALNIGVTFQTPEIFFLGQNDTWPQPAFNPSNLMRNGCVFRNESSNNDITSENQEVILWVGSPASGKSTFWKNHLSNYVRVNRDTLKTRDRCLSVLQDALRAGKSAVVDNTNPDPASRADYVKTAQQFNVPIRAFVFAISKDLAFHMDTLRLVNHNRQHLSKRVGSMPIHMFFKKFVKPTQNEGFSDVKEIQLIAGPFENKQDENMFFSFVHS